MLIGIAGGMASGKSTFAHELGRMLSLPVIDADAISRKVFERPEVQEQLRLRWDIEINDREKHLGIISGESKRPYYKDITDERGKFNRQRIGELVFNNPLELNFLQSVVGPLIKNEIDTQIERYNTRYHFAVILDIPLLFESPDWTDPLWLKCHRMVFIQCDREKRIDNYTYRSGLKPEKAKADLIAREKLQWDLERKINEALFHCIPFVTIENNGTRDEFQKKIRKYQLELYNSNIGLYNEVYGIRP